MRQYREDRFQCEVAELLSLLGWLWTHPPNGGWRRKLEAKRLRGMGVHPGVPDVLVWERWEKCADGCRWCDDHPTPALGIAIELKIGKNSPTPQQWAWLGSLRERGVLTAVCYRIGDVLDVLAHANPMNMRKCR